MKRRDFGKNNDKNLLLFAKVNSSTDVSCEFFEDCFFKKTLITEHLRATASDQEK